MSKALKSGTRSLAFAFLLLVAWQVVAEIIEPYHALWLRARLRPGSPPLEAPSVSGTLVRLYPDARPHVGKIARLQKGLVWVAEGRELVQEGYGFGCPIVIVGGQAYNSRTAQIRLQAIPGGHRLTKHFVMDTIDTPIRLLYPKYRAVSPIGVVTVHYNVYPEGHIAIQVDLSALTVPWEEVFLMSEQGADHFVRLVTADGASRSTDELGIWEVFPTATACFESADGRRRFCVQPTDDATVHVGRERYLQYNWRGIFYLNWSGVDLSIAAPRASYRYQIVLEAQ
mgnify:CR=1 FL=1